MPTPFLSWGGLRASGCTPQELSPPSTPITSSGRDSWSPAETFVTLLSTVGKAALGTVPPGHIPTACCASLLVPNITPYPTRVTAVAREHGRALRGPPSVPSSGELDATPCPGSNFCSKSDTPILVQNSQSNQERESNTTTGSDRHCTKTSALTAPGRPGWGLGLRAIPSHFWG